MGVSAPVDHSTALFLSHPSGGEGTEESWAPTCGYRWTIARSN